MSAAEKLKALHPHDLPLTASAELLHVFPQIVAVVEAAEGIWILLPEDPSAEVWVRNIDTLEDALAALDEQLGDLSSPTGSETPTAPRRIVKADVSDLEEWKP